MSYSMPPIPLSLLKRFDPSTALFLAYGNAMIDKNNGWFSMEGGVDERNESEYMGEVAWRDIGVKSQSAVDKMIENLSLFSVLEKRFSKEGESIRPVVLYRINPVIYERLAESEPIGQKRGLIKSKGTLTRFDEFWAVYPNKQGKEPARKLWASRNYDEIADTIIEDVKNRVKNHKPWQNEIRFIPHGLTYVSKKIWMDDIIPFDNRLIASSSRQNSLFSGLSPSDQARDMNIRTRRRTDEPETRSQESGRVQMPAWSEYETMSDNQVEDQPKYPAPTNFDLQRI